MFYLLPTEPSDYTKPQKDLAEDYKLSSFDTTSAVLYRLH